MTRGEWRPEGNLESLLGAARPGPILDWMAVGGRDPGALARIRDWALVERDQRVLDAVSSSLADLGDPEADVSAALRLVQAGDAGAAVGLLRQVARRPDGARATVWHHMGRALHNIGERDRALDFLRQAAAAPGSDPAAHYSLAHALRAGGQFGEAEAHYREYLAHRPGSPAARLDLGITLCAADRTGEAVALFDELLAEWPGHRPALLNRGIALHVLGHWEEARSAFERILESDPGDAQAHFHLGCLHKEQFQANAARQHLLAAVAADPGDAEAHAELAGLFEQGNDLAMAAHHVQLGLAAAPGQPSLLLEAARLARRDKRPTDAQALLRRLDPRALPERLAMQLAFESALVADALGDPSAAIAALEVAHRLEAASPRHRAVDRSAYPARIGEITAWLEAGAPGARASPLDPRPAPGFRPSFLVGFPRSGTTLLDTVIDAHDNVVSIEERPTIESVAERLGSGDARYPWGMAGLRPDDIVAARARYEAQVRAATPDGYSGLVLDKLPLRMLRVPLIRRLYPDAPILFMARHPCDVVLSNYMQQFRPNEAFVHFGSIASAADLYARIMDAWLEMCRRLPLDVHVVRYERLVASPDEELESACAALGIRYQPSALDPARRLAGRGVQTNSYHQVAEPIYQRAVGRWTRYGSWLDPVLPRLRPYIEALGYPDPPGASAPRSA